MDDAELEAVGEACDIWNDEQEHDSKDEEDRSRRVTSTPRTRYAGVPSRSTRSGTRRLTPRPEQPFGFDQQDECHDGERGRNLARRVQRNIRFG